VTVPSTRVDVLGVHVSAIDMPLALDTIEGWVSDRTRTYVCVTGVHGVMESQRDPHLLDIHNRSGMTTPDGMPLVWCGRRAGAGTMARVYGPDLMLGVMQRAAAQGWRAYFYGAAPGVADELASNLGERFPGFVNAGTFSPPYRDLTDAEVVEIADRINQAEPDIVWVGLSTPKQERWMDRFRPYLDAPVLVGVGAAFDIHAGRLPQAPSWMQDRGLEWLYRLIKEPRRLWRRYLSNNPRFVWRIFQRPPRLLPTQST
jgi:N-acetylglucosaminyldiphosphoundecaprenol N-acetyl-beta-D-mannosaminyltransferase